MASETPTFFAETTDIIQTRCYAAFRELLDSASESYAVKTNKSWADSAIVAYDPEWHDPNFTDDENESAIEEIIGEICETFIRDCKRECDASMKEGAIKIDYDYSICRESKEIEIQMSYEICFPDDPFGNLRYGLYNERYDRHMR